MKKHIFFSFIFLLLNASVYAQKTIQYVSFLPSSVVHQNASLKQDKKSFSLMDANSYTANSRYHTLAGGLVLGAGKQAKINISALNINNSGTEAINRMLVDNMVNLVSSGTIGEITNLNLGNNCDKNSCTNVRIYAADISWPVTASGSDNDVTIDVNIIDKAKVYNLLLKHSKFGTYSEFLPGLSSSDKIGWRNFRIKGTDTCRRYLVKNPIDDKTRCGDPDSPTATPIDENYINPAF